MIRETLASEVEAWTHLGVASHCLFKRLVLDRGAVFKGSFLPETVRPGAPKLCFENAYRLSRKTKGRLRYCEGFGLRTTIGFPIHHAWCVDQDGRVVDPTWSDPDACEYLGITLDPTTTARLRAITGTASAFMDRRECWVPDAVEVVAPSFCAD